MPRKKENLLNDTMTQVLLKIFSGANYASQLAIETGKSIPVVFRQLEQLMRIDILEKKRSGKKVEYNISWETIGAHMYEFIYTETKQAKEFIKNNTGTQELKTLLYDIQDIKIKELLLEILKEKKIQAIFTQLFQELNQASKKIKKYKNIEFEDGIAYFLECFGLMTKEEEIIVLQKIPQEKQNLVGEFFKICRLHTALQRVQDPLRKLKYSLLE